MPSKKARATKELQVVVVSVNKELAVPKVGPPMPNGLDQADEPMFVRRQLIVASRERPTEENERPNALMEDDAKLGARGVAVDDEAVHKMWHLKNWVGGESLLEGREGLQCLWSPGQRLLLPSRGISGSSPPSRASRAPLGRGRLRTGGDSLDLVAIHCYALGRYDMAEVGDGVQAEGALGDLQVEVVGA